LLLALVVVVGGSSVGKDPKIHFNCNFIVEMDWIGWSLWCVYGSIMAWELEWGLLSWVVSGGWV
jgi:hypothetical protein